MNKLLLVIAIAACGGGKPAHKDTMMKPMESAPTECQVVAAHVAESVTTWKDPPPVDKKTIADVIGSHCEADQWSAEAKKCFGSMTEANAEECRKTLTQDQHDKVYGDMMSKMKPPAQGAPAPDGASGGGPSKSNDPCEGGE